MTETATSMVLQEAEELLNTLSFDYRYGTHVRGRKVTITVTMMPEPASNRVRGMLHCHAFGHLRPDWNEIDVFLDYGPDFQHLGFNRLSGAVFECERPSEQEHLFRLYAVRRDLQPVATAQVPTFAGFFDPIKAQAIPPVTLDFVSHAAGLSPSARFEGGSLQLFFDTKVGSPGQQVAFWLETSEGAKIAGGRAKLEFSPLDSVWRAQWMGDLVIPQEVTKVRLLYWVVPPPAAKFT